MEKLTAIALMGCIVLIVLTFLDFASLHDIKKDYVSRDMMNYFDLRAINDLPDWTSTPGEWRIVTLSLYLRSLYFVLNALVLGYYVRKWLRTERNA